MFTHVGIAGLGDVQYDTGVPDVSSTGAGDNTTVSLSTGGGYTDVNGITYSSAVPVVASPTSNAPIAGASPTGVNLNSLINSALSFGKTILTLQPGVTTYTTPQGGTYTSVAAPGQATPGLPAGLGLPGFGTSTGSLVPLLLLGGAIILVLKVAGGK